MKSQEEDADLAGLLARVRRLEDERNIVQRLAYYAHCIDYGLEPEWVDCFTEDGVFDVRRNDPPGGLFSGPLELGRFVAAHTRAPDQYHKHLLVEPVIRWIAESVQVDSYFVRIDSLATVPTMRSFGRYRDELRLCSDGLWRIARRVVEVEARL